MSIIKFHKEHTWVKVEHQTGTIGITAFAQSELGEIVFVDLPPVGKSFKKDEIFGSIEAVKTVSDLYMPVSGQVIEVNSQLQQTPTLVNTSAESEGWMIKVVLTDSSEIDQVMDAATYLQHIQ